MPMQLEKAKANQAETAAQLEAAASVAALADGEREANLDRELSEAQSRTSQLQANLAVQMREAADTRAQLEEVTSERERLSLELASVKEALGATQAKLAGLQEEAAQRPQVGLGSISMFRSLAGG